jgi:hypothetical protein
VNKYERRARAIKILNTNYHNGYKDGFKDGMETQKQWETISKMIRIETNYPKINLLTKNDKVVISKSRKLKNGKGIKDDSRNK